MRVAVVMVSLCNNKTLTKTIRISKYILPLWAKLIIIRRESSSSPFCSEGGQGLQTHTHIHTQIQQCTTLHTTEKHIPHTDKHTQIYTYTHTPTPPYYHNIPHHTEIHIHTHHTHTHDIYKLTKTYTGTHMYSPTHTCTSHHTQKYTHANTHTTPHTEIHTLTHAYTHSPHTDIFIWHIEHTYTERHMHTNTHMHITPHHKHTRLANTWHTQTHTGHTQHTSPQTHRLICMHACAKGSDSEFTLLGELRDSVLENSWRNAKTTGVTVKQAGTLSPHPRSCNLQSSSAFNFF